MDIGFFVAGGDSSELFDATEEIFDEMAPFVDLAVERDGPVAAAPWRDDGGGTVGGDAIAQRRRIEGLVAEESRIGEIRQQVVDAVDIVALAGKEDEAHQIAEGVDQGGDLRRQATARAPDRLILSPPFAPVPCWWTRTMVPSTITYSKSGSSAKALKRLSHTPFFDQRENRFHTLFQRPKSCGRSRHGAPVREIHRTASTNNRLSPPVTPGSPALPGTRSFNRSHCPSDNINRSKTASIQKTVLNQISQTLGIP